MAANAILIFCLQALIIQWSLSHRISRNAPFDGFINDSMYADRWGREAVAYEAVIAGAPYIGNDGFIPMSYGYNLPPLITDPIPYVCEPMRPTTEPVPLICDPMPIVCDPLSAMIDPLLEITNPMPAVCEPVQEVPVIIEPIPIITEPVIIEPVIVVDEPLLPEIIEPIPVLTKEPIPPSPIPWYAEKIAPVPIVGAMYPTLAPSASLSVLVTDSNISNVFKNFYNVPNL